MKMILNDWLKNGWLVEKIPFDMRLILRSRILDIARSFSYIVDDNIKYYFVFTWNNNIYI